MRKTKQIISTALEMYFEGLSFRKVARMINRIFKVCISYPTIHKWIKKYAPLVKEYAHRLVPQCGGGKWHNDETVLKVKGENVYYWDIIDEDTKFLLDGFNSGRRRSRREARDLYKNAKEYARAFPKAIYCDGYPGYERGLASSFDNRKIEFHAKIGIRSSPNNNAIERFHATLKERIKIMRGLQNPTELLDAFIIHYNFIRPHQSLKGKTPAEKAGIKLPFKDGWKDLITWATRAQFY